DGGRARAAAARRAPAQEPAHPRRPRPARHGAVPRRPVGRVQRRGDAERAPPVFPSRKKGRPLRHASPLDASPESPPPHSHHRSPPPRARGLPDLRGAEGALRRLAARPLKSRRPPVVLDPLVTAQFLGVLSAAFNGESMLKGRSLFLDRETRSGPSASTRR